MLCKILFLQETRLFSQNCIFQHQQIFNQLLLLLCGELMDGDNPGLHSLHLRIGSILAEARTLLS